MRRPVQRTTSSDAEAMPRPLMTGDLKGYGYVRSKRQGLQHLANAGAWLVTLLFLWGWLSGRVEIVSKAATGPGNPTSRRALHDGGGDAAALVQGARPSKLANGAGLLQQVPLLRQQEVQAVKGVKGQQQGQQGQQSLQQQQLAVQQRVRGQGEKPPILVIYVFSNTDPEYLGE